MRTLERPLMGHLEWSGTRTTCDWSGTILLPSLAECYEKWEDDGTEFFRDRHNDAHRQGRFEVLILSGLPKVWRAPGDEKDDYLEPGAPHCALLICHSPSNMLNWRTV